MTRYLIVLSILAGLGTAALAYWLLPPQRGAILGLTCFFALFILMVAMLRSMSSNEGQVYSAIESFQSRALTVPTAQLPGLRKELVAYAQKNCWRDQLVEAQRIASLIDGRLCEASKHSAR